MLLLPAALYTASNASVRACTFSILQLIIGRAKRLLQRATGRVYTPNDTHLYIVSSFVTIIVIVTSVVTLQRTDVSRATVFVP